MTRDPSRSGVDVIGMILPDAVAACVNIWKEALPGTNQKEASEKYFSFCLF